MNTVLVKSLSWAALVGSLVTVVSSRPAVAKDRDSSIEIASKAVARKVVDYSFRQWFRNRVLDDDDASRYGLQLDDDWQKAAADRPELPLVVMVHGFNSTPARNVAVMLPVRAAGYPTGSFSYPNDLGLSKSAALLSRQLKAFAVEHPQQRLALVTHSMGGLVARACIEDGKLDPGNVDRLIMIAPPSQGTALARVAAASDLWEHWIGREEGGGWTRWRDSVVDGLGEAADDLSPGSPFLNELNSRPRNPRVRYAIFLGTKAAMTDGELALVRTVWERTGSRYDKLRYVRHFTHKVDVMLVDMDEVVSGKGDGVVAVKRGRLEGVDDVLILPFGHISCTGAPETAVVKQLQSEVLARLK